MGQDGYSWCRLHAGPHSRPKNFHYEPNTHELGSEGPVDKIESMVGMLWQSPR